MTKFKPIAFAALSLAAAGCYQTSPQATASLEDSIQTPQAKMMALAPAAGQPPADRPPLVAVPNTLGTVASVRTRNYTDGVRQDVSLQGGAIRGIANGMTLLVRTTRQPTLDESVPLYKPSESSIRSEIGAQFPHIELQVVDRQSSNSYGPYGLALGRAAGGVHCLYMWQWIDANRLPQGADLSGPASLRVRICRKDVTFDAMAAAMDQLVIGHEAAMSVPERVATNQDERVIVAAPEASAEVGSAKAPPRKRHAAKRKSRKAQLASSGVGSNGSGSQPAGDEPRYVPASAASPPSRSQQMQAAPAAVAEDLPPQAYLGPKSAARQPLSPVN